MTRDDPAGVAAPAQLRAGEEGGGAGMGLQDGGGEAPHRFAIGGEGDGMRVAQQQGPPGLFLQPADMLADGGLAQPQALPGGGEVPGFRDGQEGAQQQRVEG